VTVVNMGVYKDFLDDYNNRPVYTKREMQEMMNRQANQLRTNRIIQITPDGVMLALQITRYEATDEGTIVYVR